MAGRYLFLVVFSITLYMCKGSEFVIRAVKGKTVHLPCNVYPEINLLGSVEWTKTSAKKTIICKYKINIHKASTQYCIPRFTFTKESLKLNIENVQLSDFGSYSCRRVRLVPPPALDDITNVTLLVENLSLQRSKSSNESCIHLLCTLKTLNPKQVNFTWSREGQTLPHLSSSSTSSELYLCEPDWDDKDEITCEASYFYDNTLYKMKKTVTDLSDEILIRKSSAIRDIIYKLFIATMALIWVVFFVYKFMRLFSD